MSNDLLALALDALKFYAAPDVYRPDATGRTNDIRFVAQNAIAALEAAQSQPAMHKYICPETGQLCDVCPLGCEAQKDAQPVGVPAGWSLVPDDPTVEMWSAGLQMLYEASAGDIEANAMEVSNTYKAMLAAAPSLPVPIPVDEPAWVPQTALGGKLLAARGAAIASGMQLQSMDEINDRAATAGEVELPVVAWQPIETAPKDGTRFLVWPYIGKVDIDQWNETDENWLPGVTHWMPLPAAPDAQAAIAARSNHEK